MKILHVAEDYSSQAGGVRTVVKDLNFYLNRSGFNSYILSTKKEYLDDVFIVESKNHWLYSKAWLNKLMTINDKHNFDVFHIHGVWMYPQYIAAKFCIQNKIPFILSCHGMYEPWLWKKGAIKKKFYFNFVIKNIFRKAKYIHAISPQEKDNLKLLFKANEIVEIPNLITLPDDFQLQVKDEQKYILYLGRLDEKKGIDILLRAFASISNDDVILKIAGEINDYKSNLDELIVMLKISSKVEFLGHVSGNQKIRLLSNAHVLVAPSHSEVIGMVNLEAAILKTPVITTYQTGLNPEWNNNGGKLISPNTEELIMVLDDVLKWSDSERKMNGEKLYNFVIANYSWKERLKNWLELYETCVG